MSKTLTVRLTKAIEKLADANENDDLTKTWFFIRDTHFKPALDLRNKYLDSGRRGKGFLKAEADVELYGAMLGAIDKIRTAAKDVTG